MTDEQSVQLLETLKAIEAHLKRIADQAASMAHFQAKALMQPPR